MLCNEEMRKSILSRLQGYRYEHSLGVERAAIMLAEKYGEDPEKAGTAGILHDITKYLSPQEQLNLCGKYGIIPCTVEKSEPKMLHGKTAAAIARAEYHMPEDICDAIACHTTGKNHMTLLDKILYLADYIEETRDFPGVDKARELAQIDIDSALLYCYDQTLTELVARGKLIHSDTIAAYNDMIRQGVSWRDKVKWRQESFETIRRKRRQEKPQRRQHSGTGSRTAGSAQAGREPPADLGAQAGRQKGKAPKEKKS